MTFNYTDAQKAEIKRNPLNRENCKNIRVITTRYYREFQAAERALQSLSKSTPAKTQKEITASYNTAKDAYETALCKFKLYKELFPDLVQ